MEADVREATAEQRDLDAQIDPRSYTTDGQLRSDPGEP
jgi:hypothetical protein